LELKENKILKACDELAADQRFSVGNDLVFIPDFKASFNDLFKNKVYTENEIAYCSQFDDSLLRYASTWAAKEAVYKAVKQVDPKVLGPKSIEIIREKIAGRPHVVIHKDHFIFKISLTISHDGDYVWAIALIDTKL
jgi:holo-[acyl-carrier protein] synthase